MSLNYLFRLFLKYSLFALLLCVCCQILLYNHVHFEQRKPTIIGTKLFTTMQFKMFANTVSSVRKVCSITKPLPTDLDHRNTHWQYLGSSNGIFYLYHAYYDIRRSTQANPTVRILAMINRLSPMTLFCQIWFHNNSRSIETKASYHHIWNQRWENNHNFVFQPYVIDCPLKQKDLIRQNLRPKSVSIFENRCQKLRNHLQIDDNYIHQIKQGKKDTFAVCVKGLDFPSDDLSLRFIEWIELLKLLGAHRIFFYQYEVHPNISAVLKFYQSEHLVSLQPISLAGPSSDLHSMRRAIFQEKRVVRRQHEVIPYNDCFYRHMYHYRYIVLLDVDEIILPLQGGTWLSMFQRMKQIVNSNQTYAAYSARNVYFFHQNIHLLSQNLNSSLRHSFDQIPNYFHMLKQIERSKMYTKSGAYVKTFFDSERVIAVHNHHPMICFGPCHVHELNRSLAHLQHYRNDCVIELQKTCITYRKHIIQDITIWKYQQPLINRTMTIARKLHLIR